MLLGAGYGSCTSFHLAEYRTGNARAARNGAPVMSGGRRVWASFDDVELRSDLFEELGVEFERRCPVRRGRVGSAEARVFSQRTAVDYRRLVARPGSVISPLPALRQSG